MKIFSSIRCEISFLIYEPTTMIFYCIAVLPLLGVAIASYTVFQDVIYWHNLMSAFMLASPKFLEKFDAKTLPIQCLGKHLAFWSQQQQKQKDRVKNKVAINGFSLKEAFLFIFSMQKYLVLRTGCRSILSLHKYIFSIVKMVADAEIPRKRAGFLLA